MRKSTVILASTLILMLAFAALFFFGGTLTARLGVVSAAASDHPDAFAAIARVLDAGAAPQRFDDSPLGDAGDYGLEDVTLRLHNRGLFDAEWLYVEVEGAPGDVAVYSISGEGGTVPARGSAELNLKVLRRANGGGERVYRVQYYTYGLKRTIVVRQGAE